MLRERERQFHGLPPCSCGAPATLRGRYSTEAGRLTWYYRVECNHSACTKRVILLGDIWTRQNALDAWQREVMK